jgi:enoyl-CoA hydratase/carnithine racemase
MIGEQREAGSDSVLLDVSERIATVTLNRPAVRNALSSEVLHLLPQLLLTADDDDGVDVIILTGADPAFCAGLDLDELAAEGGDRLIEAVFESPGRRSRGPLPPLGKPLIGAVNGPAVTGGLELALNCDFLVASDRATFADTHTRLGVMPAWGMSVLLPQAIGVRRAREMSFTGNVIDAAEALDVGLVNHVVAHDELLPFARRLASDIVAADQAALRQVRATFAANSHDDDAWETEARAGRAWQRTRLRPDQVGAPGRPQ